MTMEPFFVFDPTSEDWHAKYPYQEMGIKIIGWIDLGWLDQEIGDGRRTGNAFVETFWDGQRQEHTRFLTRTLRLGLPWTEIYLIENVKVHYENQITFDIVEQVEPFP